MARTRRSSRASSLSPVSVLWLRKATRREAAHVVDAKDLDDVFFRLFRMRGVLDPATAVPRLGASVSEAMALSRLGQGECSQLELVHYLGLEKSTVSRLVDAMVGKGWVEKSRDPANRRYHVVRLTRDGRKAMQDVGRAMRLRHREMLAILSAEERSTLIRGLTILVEALERSEGSMADLG
jgi:DNA-binding MarR family transcriptional regulator